MSRLRNKLLLLAAAAVLPLLAISLLLSSLSASAERARALEKLESTAQSIAVAVDRTLSTYATLLRYITTTPEFAAGDYAALYERAKNAAALQDGQIVIVDSGGQQLLNTRLPPSAPLPATERSDILRAVLNASGLFVSDLVVGTVAQRPVLTVGYAATRGDGTAVAVFLAFDAQAVENVVAEQKLPPGWGAMVLDAQDNVIAKAIGRGGLIDYRGADGTAASATISEYQRSAPSELANWRVVSRAPTAEVHSAALRQFLAIVAIGLASAIVVASGTLWYARRVGEPIEKLAAAVRSFDPARHRWIFRRTGIAEIDQLAQAFSTGAERQRLLGQELHHRVKNNIGLVASLLRTQARFASPAESEALKEAILRIELIARAHQSAYESDTATEADWKRMIHSVCEGIRMRRGLSEQQIECELDLQDQPISSEQSVPLALAVNELVMNAVKHASDDSPTIRITISGKRENGRTVISVSDNGKGLPPSVTEHGGGGFGWQLVRLFVQQLEGSLSIVERVRGTCVRITVPDARDGAGSLVRDKVA